ncbi:MAG TPA: hypothetical protein VD767_12280, partial [Thermomicrobiales bacterium]|nr:hypothetical protein [Thermomicrobiales bacterium]
FSGGWDGNSYVPPYADFVQTVTITANQTFQTTITLHRIDYIPMQVTVTDANGLPVNGSVELYIKDQRHFLSGGTATIWVEREKTYSYYVYSRAVYETVTGSVTVPEDATEHTLALQLVANPTGTFTLNLPANIPPPTSSDVVELSAEDNLRNGTGVFRLLSDGTTGPITMHTAEYEYFLSYYPDNGHVSCNSTFTNATGGNITITMDCTYTPDPMDPGAIDALVAALIEALVAILSSLGY